MSHSRRVPERAVADAIAVELEARAVGSGPPGFVSDLCRASLDVRLHIGLNDGGDRQ